MANNYMGNMTFGVNFKVDTKALDQLDTYFSTLGKDINQAIDKAGKDPALVKQAQDAKKAYDTLYSSMTKAYNPKLNQFDLSKLNAQLRLAKTDLATITKDLANGGHNINAVLTTLGANKLMIKETNQFLDKMATTFGNTIRWTVTTKIINTITGAVQKAIYFTKDLDRSLNDIRVVTGKSADEMERFAKQATNAAQALGKTTTDYTKASLIYYQQGLSDKEVAARTSTTLKAANVTGQSTAEVSEQLTAVWNGYKVSAEEAEKYVDKLSAVASTTASNLEELSTGMSKVASAANMMGVDIDQLNAQLSTVISVTRQAPETIGAAFKTVYARMSTIQAGGIDEEDGATLKSYTEKMNQFGISVLDSNGKLRNMGEVIEEIGNKWDKFSREAQVGLAQAMGGTRQYSNLTALFENWDKYQKALATSQGANGTLQRQQEIYMDSVAAHFEELTAEAEKFYQTLLDSDALKGFADAMKFIVKQINGLVSGLGGGITALSNFTFQLGSLFSNQIGKKVGEKIYSANYWKDQQKNLIAQRNLQERNLNGQRTLIDTQNKVTAESLVDKDGNYTSKMGQDTARAFSSRQQRILDLTPTKAFISNKEKDPDIAEYKEQHNFKDRLIQNSKAVIDNESYNQLTTLNEQIAALDTQIEEYEAVDKAVKDITGNQEMSVEKAQQLIEEYEAADKEIEKLSHSLKRLKADQAAINAENEKAINPYKQKQEDIQKLNSANYSTKAIFKADSNGNTRVAKTNTGDNTNVKLENGKVISNNTNNAGQQLSQVYQNYLKVAQVAKEEKALTNEQKQTFTDITNQLKNGMEPNAEAVKKVMEDTDTIIKQIVEHLNQAIEKTKDASGIHEIEDAIDNIEGAIKDQQDVQQSEGRESLANANITSAITHVAQGPTKDQMENAKASKEGEFEDVIRHQAALSKTQKTTQKLMGTMQALTGVMGSLQAFSKDGATGMEKYEAAFSGASSAISGAATAAFGPIGGMVAGAATSIVHGILDITGASENLAELLKSDAEKYADFQRSIEETSERIQKKKDEIAANASTTKSYHEDMKNLASLKAEWEKLQNTLQQNGKLTKAEQERYDSILEDIIELNPEIVAGYDSQHKAILTVNDALGDTIKKLQEEYELQVKLGNIKGTEDSAEIVKEELEQAKILEKQREQGEEKKNEYLSDLHLGMGDARKDDALSRYSDAMLNAVAQDDTRNVEIFNDYLKVIGAQTEKELADALDHFEEKYYKDGQLLDDNKKALKAAVNAADEVLQSAKDRDQGAKYLTEDRDWFDTASATAFEDMIGADLMAVMDPYGSKYDANIQKVYSNAISDASTFSSTYLTSDKLDELTGVPDQIISSLMTSAQSHLNEDVQDIVTKAQNGEISTDKMDNQIKEIYEEATSMLNEAFSKFGLKEQERYEELGQKLGNIRTDMNSMNIDEYNRKIEYIREEYRKQAIKIFGDDAAAIEGYLQSTMGNDASSEKFDETKNLLNKAGFNADNIMSSTSAKDYNYLADFASKVNQNPNAYTANGADYESQFETYKELEHSIMPFKEALPEINAQLDELKQQSLEGTALDEESFEGLVDQLETYGTKLKGVQTELDILTDKELYGSQVWIEALKRVEAELEKTQEKNLLQDRQNFVLSIDADTTEADNVIKDLINQDYKIMVDIEAQGADTYNTAVTDIENLKTALSYVGEEGKVAAENVLDLLNAFPELNDMIQNNINNDGTISLTKQQIDLIKERTEVDIAGTVAAAEMELQTQLNRAEQEQKLTEAQIEMVEQELENFSDSQEAKEDFVKRFSGLYADYSDAQVEITETNNDVINTDTWETADAITDYWVDAYSNANTAYLDFVKNVIEGNKAMQGLENNFDPSNTIANSGIREQKLNGSSATLSQDILDRVNQAQGEGEYKKALEESLAALRSKYQLNKKITEEIKNEMLALNVQGLEAVKTADDIGKKTKEDAWQAKHLYDYYHDVNKELDFINQKLTVLQKKQKLLEGSALLKNLKLQSKEYENQIKYLQQKRGIQEGYQQELQTRQKDELGNKGLAAYGITFDKNGYIENYAEIAKKLQEGQHDKESVEDYQNFINQVKTYEDNLKLALDLEGQLYDVVAKRQELQGKAVEERIKMILDVADAKKKYMEFTKELGNWKVNLIINPDQTAVDAAAAKTANSFVKSSIKAMSKNADLVAEGSAAVDRLKAGDFDKDKNGNLTDYVSFNGSQYKMEDLLKMEEDVDKFADAASQSAADIQQAYQQTLDAYSNAMKELNDWDKRVLAKYDMINSVYDHAEKLTELWYGKDSLEAQIMLTSNQQDKTANLYEKAKEANKQVKEDWDIYQKAVATGNEKLAEEAYDAWSESVQNLQSLTEEYAEQRKKQLTDELALAAKIVETQIYGGKSREEFVNSWDLINKKAETYLDTINAQFGVTQLENKYLQAINKSIGNTKAQEKINKIMNEEMKMLKEKDKLTKYDLERAEAKYDLTLKQIALEEARDNKTNLRLRRDSQGNYTYQYTANQDDILKAQNDVDIAKNNLYNMDRDRHQELTQQAIDLEKEYYDRLAEIQEKFADDEDARLAAEKELYDAYFGEGGIITGVLDERAVAFENLNESISESITGTGEGTILGSFEKLKEDLPAKVSELSPSLQPEVKKVIDLWSSHETGLPKAYDILRTDTQQFFTDYKDDIAKAASELDQDTVFGKVRTVFEDTKTKVDEFKEAAGNANTAIGDLNTTGSKFSLEKLITQFETLTTDLGGADDPNGLITRIQQANTELEELVNPEQKKKNFKEIRKSLAKIRDTLDKNKDKFDTALKDIDEWKKKVIEHAKDAKTEIGLVADALNSLKDKKVTVTVETVYTQKGSPTKDSDGTGPKQDLTPKPTNPSGDDIVGKTVYYVIPNQASSTRYYFESSRAAQDAVSSLKAKDKNSSADWGTTTTTQVSADAYLSAVSYDSYGAPRDIRATTKKIKELRTGGYTGVWGEEGKLAVLHEKELVLNKEDTENILDAVDLIRQIDMKQMQMNMMENYITALQRVQDKYALESSQPTQINQNITINADFPDATDRDEIKAAFDSLVNLASQRVMTKRH